MIFVSIICKQFMWYVFLVSFLVSEHPTRSSLLDVLYLLNRKIFYTYWALQQLAIQVDPSSQCYCSCHSSLSYNIKHALSSSW